MSVLRGWLLVCMVIGAGGCSKAPITVHGQSVPYWVEALGKPDPRLRKQAVEALGNAGAADPAVVPALMRAVKDPDAGIRAAAGLALLKIGPDAEEAIPVLTAAQKDSNARVRRYAVEALARIRGDSPNQ